MVSLSRRQDVRGTDHNNRAEHLAGVSFEPATLADLALAGAGYPCAAGLAVVGADSLNRTGHNPFARLINHQTLRKVKFDLSGVNTRRRAI